MMNKPTNPVPLKERVTSRSLLGMLGLNLTSVIDLVGGNFIDGEFSESNIWLHVVSVVIFAIGYARDVAMAWIEAKAAAHDVKFDQAQEVAQTDIDALFKAMTNLANRQDNLETKHRILGALKGGDAAPDDAISSVPSMLQQQAAQNIPPTLTSAQVAARNAAAAAEVRKPAVEQAPASEHTSDLGDEDYEGRLLQAPNEE